jgi:hypothetical protein
MSLHSNTLFWFPKQPVLFLLLNVVTWRRSNTDQFHSLWFYPTENGLHNILQSMRAYQPLQQRDGILQRKNYTSRALELTSVFGGVRVPHLFSFLCVVSFWVPFCDVSYDFCIRTMFGSSLPPAVCKRAHVLSTFSVCLGIVLSNTYYVVFLFCISSSCIHYFASLSGLSNFDCSFSILWRLFHYVSCAWKGLNKAILQMIKEVSVIVWIIHTNIVVLKSNFCWNW